MTTESRLSDGGGSMFVGHGVGHTRNADVETRHRATRFVASTARDAEDAATLLSMLGLNPAEGKRDERAA